MTTATTTKTRQNRKAQREVKKWLRELPVLEAKRDAMKARWLKTYGNLDVFCEPEESIYGHRIDSLWIETARILKETSA